MSAQMERAKVEEHTDRISIPQPVENGSYDVESLGGFVDRLMGDRGVRAAAATTIRILAGENEPSEQSEEAPVEVPPPVPGGNEPITKGDDPPAEKR